MYLHVSKGTEFWLVFLANREDAHNWIVLGSFPTKEQAIAFANKLTTLEVEVDD